MGFEMIHIVAVLAAFAIAAIVFFLLGIVYRKKVSEKEISSAEEEARRIINEAIKNSENKKREALLEAKEEILRARSEYEKEEKQRRSDLQKSERRLQQNPDRATLEMIDYIKSEPMIRLIVAGHVHRNFEEPLDNGVMQICTHAGYAGYARELILT